MQDDLASWLGELGLGRYAGTFSDNDVDFDSLSELSDSDLIELGLSLGHRRRLLKAIRELQSQSDSDGDSDRQIVDDAERRQLTVMFCDLVGSTNLSIRLDPEELREVISEYQKCCERVVKKFGGHVARYMGDGLLVYFGYPRAHENDPELAILAGMEIIRSVHELRPRDAIQLQTRVGIATGDVVVGGLIGAGSARERSVVGETPNLAARFQGLAQPDQVVVGEVTHKLARGLFEFSHLGQHTLKGFDREISVWCVDQERTTDNRFEAIHTDDELVPLVSRDEETELLMAAWSNVLAGNGNAVLISGEAGIGKSRMIHALTQRLAGVPHILLRYFCVSHYQNTALYPVIRQLERAAELQPGDSPDAKLRKLETLLARGDGEAAEVVPVLAALLSIPTDGRYPFLNLSPQKWMERTLQVLERQLSGLARHRPVLVLFEDLHWIDSTSFELLQRIVQLIQELPVLLVMTVRPDVELAWRNPSAITMLRLDRLSNADSAALATHVASQKSLPKEVIEQILTKAEGVPLFIEELTNMAIESQLLEEIDGTYKLVRPLHEFALPNSLQDLLTARLDQLEGAKDLAQTGAAIGRQFSHKLVSAVTTAKPKQLNVAIDKLISTGLISGSGDVPEAVYTFKHALIQDSAYSLLLKGKRRELHYAIAEALREQFPEVAEVRPEMLAHHYSRAENNEQAIDYWHRAAVLATDRAAHADAIRHVTTALELLEALPVDERRVHTEIGLQVTLGRNQEVTMGYSAAEVEQTFARAHELCNSLGGSPEQVPVLLGLTVFNLVRARCSTTVELAEQCAKLSRKAGHVDFLIESYAVLAFALAHSGRLLEAREISDKCVDLYNSRTGERFVPVTAQDPAVAALSVNAIVLWLLGYPQKSIECADSAYALAQELDQPINLAVFHTHAAELYQLRGEPDKASKHAQLAIDVSSEHGYGYWQFLATAHLGIALGLLGDAFEGLALTSEALSALGVMNVEANFTYFFGGESQIHRAEGRADKGLVLSNRSLDQVTRTGEGFHCALLHILRGECRLELAEPDVDGAEEDFLRAIGIATEQGANMMRLRATRRLCELHHSQGHDSSSGQLLKDALAQITEGFDAPDVTEGRDLLVRLESVGT